MRAWCYNAAYLLLLLFWGPVLLWQRLVSGKTRGGWAERLLGPTVPGGDGRPTVWLHAVSVGEVNLLVTLVPALQQRFEGHRWVISATTDSGLALAQERFPTATVVRFPLDFSWAMARLIRQVQPALVVLTELEIWPNLLAALQRRGTPVVVVNGRLSEKSFRRYGWVRRWLQPVWRSLALVLVQTEAYRQRFVALGVPSERCQVVGSIKFDAAGSRLRDGGEVESLRGWAGLTDDDCVWLAGSTSAPEEAIALQVFQELRRECSALRLVLVPRHRERFAEVAELCRGSGRVVWQRSQGEPPAGLRWEILVVDTIGELATWWGTAQVGFVGGSMGARGGQSMIEPAGWGVPLCFGANTGNFRDVVSLLLAEQAAEVVRDASELRQFVGRVYRQRDWGRAMGQRAQAIALSQRGATERTVQQLQALGWGVLGGVGEAVTRVERVGQVEQSAEGAAVDRVKRVEEGDRVARGGRQADREMGAEP